MTGRRLDVWCFDEKAGVLVDDPGALSFSYAQPWVASGMLPLSQSLPLDGSYDPAAVSAFFGGLLPEGAPRELLSRQLGVSVANDFGFLEALGGDTAGAVSLLPPGTGPGKAGEDVQWLTESELAELIDELPTRPMHADEDGEYRLSLAGVQDKLPVVVGEGGRVGLTKGRTPSTHILKTPIPRLDDTVANEALCPAIGRMLDVDTVRATTHRVAGRSFLLVDRYDRQGRDAAVRRLHQEDFCQALAIPSQRKYQSEGGPSLPDCFALVRRAVAVPAREAPRLLDFVALSFLVGNHDAHGKNYSLLYVPGSHKAELAPAYDILSTIAYDKVRPMSRKLAMSIGGEYRPDYVRPRHLERLLVDAGLGVAAARRRLRALATAAPAAARDARATLAGDGWDAPVLGRIVEIVDRRASLLEAMTAPAQPKARRT